MRRMMGMGLACCLWAATSVMAADDPITAALSGDRFPADKVQDAWRRPYEVLKFLEIEPGHQVLDFYAGPGYYSELLARIVGSDGQVLIYNNELYTQAAFSSLMTRLARQRLPNAKTVNAPSNYLKLEPASLDRVLIVLTYHDIYWQPSDSPEPMGDPKKVLANLHRGLKPGGLVVVVDHVANTASRAEATTIANRLHRIDPTLVKEDFANAGFEFVGESDVLRHASDDHTKSVFNATVRHRTDQFVYKFRKR